MLEYVLGFIYLILDRISDYSLENPAKHTHPGAGAGSVSARKAPRARVVPTGPYKILPVCIENVQHVGV